MTRRSWFVLFLAASLWGASYLLIKVALDDGLSEPLIVFARTALGALVLVPLAVRAGAVPALLERKRAVLVLALAQVIVPFGLITFGQQWVPTSLTGVLVAATPLFIALAAVWVDQEERSEGWGLAGVLGGMAGVGLLMGADLGGDAWQILGGVMMLGAAACYGAAVLVVKRSFRGVPPVGVAASTMAVSAVAYLPFTLAALPPALPSAEASLALLVLGVGGTGLAFLFFYSLIVEVGAAKAAVIDYIVPAFAVLYGVTLAGERLTHATVAGLALVLAGSWLAAQGRPPVRLRRPRPAEVPA